MGDESQGTAEDVQLSVKDVGVTKPATKEDQGEDKVIGKDKGEVKKVKNSDVVEEGEAVDREKTEVSSRDSTKEGLKDLKIVVEAEKKRPVRQSKLKAQKTLEVLRKNK